MADLDLSIACSFQLVLVTDTSIGSTLQAKHHALSTVELALSQDVQATCVTCQKKHKFNIEFNPASKSRPLQWSTEVDLSPLSGDHEAPATGCQLHGLKLTTPTFRTSAIYSTSSENDGHVHQLDYSGMIKAVLRHAHRTLGTLSSGHAAHQWLYAPADRRMEVRIGNNDLGFLDSTYEKVEALTKVCSRQLDTLHMGRGQGKDPGTTDAAQRSSSTINLDQAPSTLDSTQALAWIDFCLSAVQSCADPDFKLDLSTKGPFASPTFSASDLLQAFGTSLTTQRFYDSKVADHQTRCQEAIASAMLAVSSGSKIAELALNSANQELKNTTSDAVLANIKVKLLAGEYGRFSDSYLKVALLSLNTDM